MAGKQNKMRIENNNWSSPSSEEHGRSDFCDYEIGTKLGGSRFNGQCESSRRNRSVKIYSIATSTSGRRYFWCVVVEECKESSNRHSEFS